MNEDKHIEEADIVIDLSGGRLAAQKYRERIADLQSQLAKAEAENKRLRELGKYAAHKASCIKRYNDMGRCDCGFTEALKPEPKGG